MINLEFLALVGFISGGGGNVSENSEQPKKPRKSFFGGWFDFKAFKQRKVLDPRLDANHPNHLKIQALIDQRDNYVVYVDTEYNVRWAANTEPTAPHFKELFARIRDLDSANSVLEIHDKKKKFSHLIAHCIAGLFADEPHEITESRVIKAEKMLEVIEHETPQIPVKVFVSYGRNQSSALLGQATRRSRVDGGWIGMFA